MQGRLVRHRRPSEGPPSARQERARLIAATLDLKVPPPGWSQKTRLLTEAQRDVYEHLKRKAQWQRRNPSPSAEASSAGEGRASIRSGQTAPSDGGARERAQPAPCRSPCLRSRGETPSASRTGRAPLPSGNGPGDLLPEGEEGLSGAFDDDRGGPAPFLQVFQGEVTSSAPKGTRGGERADLCRQLSLFRTEQGWSSTAAIAPLTKAEEALMPCIPRQQTAPTHVEEAAPLGAPPLQERGSTGGALVEESKELVSQDRRRRNGNVRSEEPRLPDADGLRPLPSSEVSSREQEASMLRILHNAEGLRPLSSREVSCREQEAPYPMEEAAPLGAPPGRAPSYPIGRAPLLPRKRPCQALSMPPPQRSLSSAPQTNAPNSTRARPAPAGQSPAVSAVGVLVEAIADQLRMGRLAEALKRDAMRQREADRTARGRARKHQDFHCSHAHAQAEPQKRRRMALAPQATRYSELHKVSIPSTPRGTFPGLPSQFLPALILGYWGYAGEVSWLLRCLSKRTRTFRGRQAATLSQACVRWRPKPQPPL